MDSYLIFETLFLLFLSGFFSFSETCLVAVDESVIFHKASKKNKSAAIVKKMLEKKTEFLHMILIANNIVNITIASVTTERVITAFGSRFMLFSVPIITLIIIIFSEIVPKNIALNCTIKGALHALPVTRFLVYIFYPFYLLLKPLVIILNKLSVRQNNESKIQDLILGKINLYHKNGLIKKSYKNHFIGIINLSRLTVEDLMTHRRSVISININDNIDKIIDQIKINRHTRFPVWEGNKENIIGIIHKKSLINILLSDKKITKENLLSVLRTAQFVPYTTQAFIQLQYFQAHQEHIAVVIDEYGSVLGIVTLEDIIEEIVGDICDEEERKDLKISQQKDGSVIAKGDVTVRDISRFSDLMTNMNNTSTIAGYLIEKTKEIPKKGSIIFLDSYRFTILDRKKNRIVLVKIEKME